MRYPGESNLLKEQRTPRAIQGSALEEDERIDQRSPSHLSDANAHMRAVISTLNWVTENMPTKQTGLWNRT